MIETKPWPGHRELDAGMPETARTVELTAQEIREALMFYIHGTTRFVGHVVMQVQIPAPPAAGELVDLTMRVTYWPTDPVTP
jgi:hypothetical protein